MSNPEDDVTTSPNDPEGSGLGNLGADLQAALGDLLGDDEGDDGGEEFDLSLLEDAVAELGMDVGRSSSDAPESQPSAQPGLDLTELPPPAPGAVATPATPPPPPPPPAAPFGDAAPARKLPPLGQASADDLFGPLDDEDLGGDWEPAGASPGEDSAELPPYEAAPITDDDPVQLPAPQAPPPSATPTTDEVVAYAAHRGRLGDEVAAKARKLFGR